MYKAFYKLEKARKRSEERIRIDQIKEKWGTLRFYITGGDDFADDVVEEAMEKSQYVCEACGRPGNIRSKGWFTT